MLEVEKYPCNDKREAEKREQYWIELQQDKLNSQRAFATEEQNKERKKQDDNKYRLGHKEQKKEHNKQYQLEHRDKMNEYQRAYYLRKKLEKNNLTNL